MTKPETIKNLEKRYNVRIERSTFLGAYYSNVERESFRIYSGDGCCWDNVIGYRSLVKTLAEDREALKRLARV